MVISYIKLTIAALLPVLLSIVLYEVKKKNSNWDERSMRSQVIIGIAFGILAVIGTEWGIPMDGYKVNCRDAAPICAGLLFGGPAGIIAGMIGGVERWFSVYWGGGEFTRVACSVSTIAVGIAAAAIRKFMLDDRRPGWLLAFFLGVSLEVFHLTMVFLTNIRQAAEAMHVVKVCTAPMITANGLSVLMATMALTVLSGKQIVRGKGQRHVVDLIQRWLLTSILVAFALTTLFMYVTQSELAERNAESLLNLSLTDMVEEIESTEDDDPDGLHAQIANAADNRHVGESGALIIADSSGTILSEPDEYTDLTRGCLQDYDPVDSEEYRMYEISADGQDYYIMYTTELDYYIVAVLPKSEAMEYRDLSAFLIGYTQILVSALLFVMIYMLIKKVVVNGIYATNDSLAKITDGDLDVIVEVRHAKEFARLSDGINATVSALKKYIAEANARIDRELQMAKDIQSAALPTALPYGENTGLYASMNPAKEVGGDFFDFYFTDKNRLVLLIADVSGKGIPAALFMMRAKTQLKGLTEVGHTMDEVLTLGNDALCEGNDADMFVTAWEGMVDLTTGLLTYANAGHNPPLIKRADGRFEYLRCKRGMVLAAMEGMRYQTNTLQLAEGDEIFLYTDGVTEATNSSGELYGEGRLQAALNARPFENMEELCRFVKFDVDKFVGEADQFDDITMLAYRYSPKTFL